MENDRGRCATCEYNIAGRCDILGDGVKGNSRCSEYEKRGCKKNGAVVYINLHPNYDYANAIIQEGYIASLKEYVKAVDWLAWDYVTKGRSMIRIFGHPFKTGSDHLKRTNVFVCRLLNEGVTVFERDERDEPWQEVSNIELSEAEMYEIEIEHTETDEERWANERAIKYIPLYKGAIDNQNVSYEEKELYKNSIQALEDDMKKVQEIELERKEKIRKIWVNG